MGSLLSPLAFLAGRKFGGPIAGGLWAVFVAVSPIHIMLGRNLGAPWVYELAFQLGLLWLTERYLGAKEHSHKSAAALCGCLAGYLWCGNQMLAFVPVLGYALVAHTVALPKVERAGFLSSKLWTWWLDVPAVSGAWLLYCTFEWHEGHLYHALFEKRKALGWYWVNVYSDLVRNVGYIPAWSCLAALACGLVVPYAAIDRRRIPLVYALCYFLPFVFLIGRGTTLTRGYSVYGLTGLFGLLALLPNHLRQLGLGRFRHDIWTRHAVPAIAVVFLVLGTGSSAYRLYGGGLLGVKGFQGSYGRQTGVAAAAAFISDPTNAVNALTGRVFSDAYGGTGLEPPIMRLYFRRKHFAHYDASRMAPWKAFASKASEIDFAVIRPENAELVGQYFSSLALAAKIATRGSDEPILLVYVRDFRGAPQRLLAEDGVASYRRAFAGFCPASTVR